MSIGDAKIGNLRVANMVAGAFALLVGVLLVTQAVGAFQPSSGAAVSGKIEKGNVAIDESGLAFVNGSRTVAVGTTVSWTNHDGASHTVTADDKSFDSGTQKTGQVFTHKFRGIGRYTYSCRIHPFMKGSIIVVAPYGS